MEIGWLRDLVICIAGIVAAGVLIFVAVLLYKLYRRVRVILDSVKSTSRTIEELSSLAGGGIAKPVIQVVAVVQGIRQGIESVSKLFSRKGGRDGG